MSEFTITEAVIGLRQSLKAIRKEQARKVYLACDASADVILSIIDACRAVQVSDINRSFTMAQLGELAQIDVGAAVIVIKK